MSTVRCMIAWYRIGVTKRVYLLWLLQKRYNFRVIIRHRQQLRVHFLIRRFTRSLHLWLSTWVTLLWWHVFLSCNIVLKWFFGGIVQIWGQHWREREKEVEHNMSTLFLSNVPNCAISWQLVALSLKIRSPKRLLLSIYAEYHVETRRWVIRCPRSKLTLVLYLEEEPKECSFKIIYAIIYVYWSGS